MRLRVLSGASGLDANAYLLHIADRAILLDVGSAQHDAYLESLPPLDAVFVSHAHGDHMGGLSNVFTRQPSCKVFAHQDTCAVSAFALAGKLTRSGVANPRALARSIQELMIPLQALQTITLWSWCTPSGDEACVDVTLFPAGHILGASSLLLDIAIGTMRRRVYYSGDFCTHDQLLVQGASLPVPSSAKPMDLLLMEGVLGSAKDVGKIDHVAERARFADLISTHHGPRLIAASALGEAQELAQVLSVAKTDVLVHDLSKPIFDAYQASSTRRGKAKSLPLFERVRFGSLLECRDELHAGRAVIASDTHMSHKTPSHQLMASILHREDALAVLCNSVRERSPASALKNTAHGQQLCPASGWNERRLCAKIEHVILPNHAPRWGLLGTVRALKPCKVVLVHGRRRSLEHVQKKILKSKLCSDVLVPKKW